MKLIKLTLENFQGIKYQSFDFNGENAVVYGDNGTGKTTVFNAITWLLFDKASTGVKGYSPKTNNSEGLYVNNLEHSSEAVFRLDSGQVIKFKKVFKEVYKKKRGSNDAEFDGHTVDYFIDDVPTGTEKEYINTILTLCNNDIEILKNVTMLDYFASELSWTNRREILLDICGDITDREVIESSKELSELNVILLKNGTENQFYTVDEYKKIAVAKKKEINKTLESIPSRIDEVKRGMPNLEGVDFDKVCKEIEQLEIEKQVVESERSSAIASAGDTNVILANLSNLKADMAQARQSFIEGQGKLNEAKHKQISDSKSRQNLLTIDISGLETTKEVKEKKLNKLTTDRNSLIEEVKEVQKMSWDNSKEICPTCNQSLPIDNIEKLKEEFNLKKSNKLATLQTKGQNECNKDMIAEVEKEIVEIGNQIESKKSELEVEKAKEEELRNSLVIEIPFEETKNYANWKVQIDNQEKMLSSGNLKSDEITRGYVVRISEIASKIQELQIVLSKKEVVQSSNARIEELEKQETELAREYQNIEKNIFICELFVKTKVSMLTYKINSRFNNVRFRLFVEQQNGGLKEDCEVMVRNDKEILVPYTNANNAGKINAGLEIIEVLSEYYGVQMPVFVDNAESVTKLKEVSAQIVRLVVSEADKSLRLGA